ncbi:MULTISPECIES: hypothetical protein [unclassified Oceanispirochaeta]|uniref:hypothetical protein n=1 Tax=unclassified Oceanispirochaeta TaxID=2635722 RepID=UPI000E097DF6|nr:MULTISPECIES: hypothetical protein [unclassified Oceanispirochaeta]MBF9018747.1 hypothetical protein [Oceanispirochaeta sp. M2]NPD75185.1 hypothetical protein [Oceanispirochaeta sp. M1]RDG28968.1 hypothetical protein DV872_24120 [Oceanispirochaeta sp. M1]
MSFLIKLKTWATRAAFVLAGILGAVLGMTLWGRSSADHEDNEQEEGKSAEDFKDEQREFERMSQIREESREEILSLPDDDFDRRYPSVPRDATQGGDRFVDRCKRHLQSRRGNTNSGDDHDHSPGGD